MSISAAVFAGLTSVTDRQTDRQTDRPRYLVGNNRPHLRKNKNINSNNDNNNNNIVLDRLAMHLSCYRISSNRFGKRMFKVGRVVEKNNYTACADFPTGVQLGEDTTALLIY